jgi:hypothetical protein
MSEFAGNLPVIPTINDGNAKRKDIKYLREFCTGEIVLMPVIILIILFWALNISFAPCSVTPI